MAFERPLHCSPRAPRRLVHGRKLLLEQRRIIFRRALGMEDQAGIPQCVQIRLVIEKLDVDRVATLIASAVRLLALDGVKRLMQVADEMHEVLEGIRAIERLGLAVLDDRLHSLDSMNAAM